jgi:16S rRNA (guanine1516-N2)-methyltransferase
VGDFPAFAGLIEHLGIPFAEEAPKGAFLLVETTRGIELRPPDAWGRDGIRAIFPPDSGAPARGARSPLSKAFGNRITTVLDLTAGLGSDAYRLAAAGYEVRAWERDPAVFAMLTSGWGVSVSEGRIPSDVIDRLSFRWGDAREALAEFRGRSLGAYFDPMYPEPRRRSALPKRPLQVLREWLEDREEPVELVSSARDLLSRVVVKRPHHAPPILPGVGFEVRTKLVRFDVYLNPEQMEARDS